MRKLAFTLFLLFSFTVLSISCGGGGGGGASAGNPAAVTIEIAPSTIDSGDRVNGRVRLRDIQVEDFNGLIIKILHPSALEYVDDSAALELPGTTDFAFAPTSANADEASYLLFYIDTDRISANDRRADITFLLEGTGRLSRSDVSVDVDAADSDTRPSFDPSNPQFTALDSTSVEVIDS